MYLLIDKSKSNKNSYGLLENRNTDDHPDKTKIVNVPRLNKFSKALVPFEKWKAENDFYIYMVVKDIMCQVNKIRIDDAAVFVNESGFRDNMERMLYKMAVNRYKL